MEHDNREIVEQVVQIHFVSDEFERHSARFCTLVIQTNYFIPTFMILSYVVVMVVLQVIQHPD